MKPEDCKGCEFFQPTTYKDYTTYDCLRNCRPIHLFNKCPKDKPFETLEFIGAVKRKLLGMIGDGKDTNENLRGVVKWIESIEKGVKITMFKAAKEATKYIGHPYGQGDEGLDVRRDFIAGYEKAVKDIKELLSAKYEERRLQYVANRTAYNEGVIDGIDFIEQAVDELTK